MDDEVHKLGSWDLIVADITRKLSTQDNPQLTLQGDPYRLEYRFHTPGHLWVISHRALYTTCPPQALPYVNTRGGRVGLVDGLVEQARRIRRRRLEEEAALPPTLWDHLDDA